MPKQTKLKFLPKFLTIFLAVAFTAQGCNLLGPPRAGGRQVELVWWKPFEDARFVQPLVEEFQRAHPNIHIKFVQKPIETYEDELVDALAAGQGPDIFSLHNDWLPKHKNKIAPAPEGLWSIREFQEKFLEVVNSELVDAGKIYGAPLSMDVLALYYNKDILAAAGLARPPATWEDLVKITPKLTKTDAFGNFERSAIALGTADNINRAPDILGLLMLQNGTPFFTPDRGQSLIAGSIRDEQGNYFTPGKRALEFYTQFANPGKVTYTWNNRSNNSIDAFAAGQVAMVFGYSYLRPTLANKAPFLNYAVTGVPQLEAGKSKVNFANYWAESVSKQSREQEAAWQFLKFITDPKVLEKYYEVQKAPSSRIDLLEKQIADPELGVFAENALSAKSFYKPQSDAVESIFAQMINDVVLRNITPEQALNAASQKINLLLKNF